MKPPVFAYVAPRTVAETVRTLAEHDGGAVLLAGGQSLMPLLNRRRVRPTVLVDLNGVGGLDTVELGAGAVRIGALARLRALERHAPLRAALPVLHQTVRLVAHPQIRSRATLGGSLCHADPAAELPALALALGARLLLTATGGERTVPAEEFYGPDRGTAPRPGEVLTAVELPLPAGHRFHFEEIPRHAYGGLPLVGVCAGVRQAADGTVERAVVTAAGAGDRPLRLAHAEQALTGRELRTAAEDPGDILATLESLTPPSDAYGSGAYRRALLRTALRRALTALAAGQEAP